MIARIIAIALAIVAAAAHADVVTEWNAIAQSTVDRVDPFLQIRTTTIAQVAVFEAVNSIGRQYEPYLRRIDSPPNASVEAAAVSAAHRVLSTLNPEQAAYLDGLRAKALAAIADGPSKDSGIKVGIHAADAILAHRANDGTDVDVPYTPGTKPGQYQLTPPEFAPAFRPGMGRITPFALRHGAQFRPEPPPSFRSARYVRDYIEVKEGGDVNSQVRTPHQSDIARFYAATDGVQAYYPAARQVSEAQSTSVAANARIFALLGIAMFDAAVAVFDAKYHYDYWRPVTAIRAADRDGNPKTQPDTAWLPLVGNPPFPSYPSGHAGFGAAARLVLEEAFGVDGHAITLTNPLVPDVTLKYSSWKQITDDVDDARVFGGVHFRFDQEEATRLGRRVGRYILERQLLPSRHCGAALTSSPSPPA
jgi:hypothetical protein